MEVLIDTNIFMAPFNFGVDVFEQLKGMGYTEFATLDLVVGELERICGKKGSRSKAARMGLDILKENGVRIIRAAGRTQTGR
jgi:rRNA-processing protein FCF1